jgi:NAD(P)-dependent dehydrogenase (short-subunit alcohol dehydrogenase family)
MRSDPNIRGDRGRTFHTADNVLSNLTYFFAGDLSTDSAAHALAVRNPELDILVNNLGIYEAKSFQDGTGVTVNAVLPGGTASEGVTELLT